MRQRPTLICIALVAFGSRVHANGVIEDKFTKGTKGTAYDLHIKFNTAIDDVKVVDGNGNEIANPGPFLMPPNGRGTSSITFVGGFPGTVAPNGTAPTQPAAGVALYQFHGQANEVKIKDWYWTDANHNKMLLAESDCFPEGSLDLEAKVCRPNVLSNSAFEGQGGISSGQVLGAVPDGWHAFTDPQVPVELVPLHFVAHQMFEGSPAATALELRALRPQGVSGIDSSPQPVALTPGVPHRARFYARSANPDGATQMLLVGLQTDPNRSQIAPTPSQRMQVAVEKDWKPIELLFGPVSEPAQLGFLTFVVVADGGWDVIDIALPTLAPLTPDAPTPPRAAFLRTDSNGDGSVNIADPVNLLQHLFRGAGRVPCQDAADSNDDGRVDIGDVIFTLLHQFRGGIIVPAPGADACGPDPTADPLECETEPAACATLQPER